MKIILTENQLKKVQKTINEDLDYNDNSYTYDCKADINYYGKTFKGNEIADIDVSKIRVNFDIVLDYKNSGIFGAMFLINPERSSDELELEVKYYIDDEGDYETENITLPINWDSVQEDYESEQGYIGIGNEINVELMNNEDGSLAIQSMTVYFNNPLR